MFIDGDYSFSISLFFSDVNNGEIWFRFDGPKEGPTIKLVDVGLFSSFKIFNFLFNYIYIHIYSVFLHDRRTTKHVKQDHMIT